MIQGILLALGAAAGWAHNSIVYTFAGKRVGSNTTAHIRLWIAFPACLLIQLALTGNLIPQSHSGLSFLTSILSGSLGYFLADLFIFRAFVLIGPRDTMLVLTSSPLFSAIFSFIFYGEVLNYLDIVSAVLILTGIIIVIWNPGTHSTSAGGVASGTPHTNARDRKKRLKGITVALVGSLGQSLGIILSKYSLLAGDSPVEINVLRIGAGLVSMLIFSLFQGQVSEDFKKMKDRRALFLIAFGALVGPTFGILAALHAVLHIPVALAAVLMQTTPIMLLPFEKLFFGRSINITVILATTLSITGIILLLL